jgi:hypothetical protein
MDANLNIVIDFLTDRTNRVALTVISLFMMLTIALFIEQLIRSSFSSVIIFLVLIGYFAFSL